MAGVVLAIALSVWAGVVAERRLGARAQVVSRRVLDVMLFGLLPGVTFFILARVELTVGVGVGIGLAYAELAIVGLLAYAVGRHLLGLPRAGVGALVCTVVLANTGYLGLPLTAALLGRGDLGPAVVFDTLVSGPMTYVVGFAIGAAFGTRGGASVADRAVAFLARNPPLWAAIAGLVAPDALAPDALVEASKTLVLLLLPFGFFAVGVNLAAEAEEGALAIPPAFTAPVAAAVALRLVVAPALLAAGSALVVELPDAYLVQAAMPSGVNALIVSHAYGLDLRIASSAIAWTTALAVVAAVVLAAAGAA